MTCLRCRIFFAFLILSIAGRIFAAAESPKTRPDGSRNRAVWMAEGKFGIMVHYLLQTEGNTPEEKTESLNRFADAFDLPFFMQQFDQTGADWLIFTLGQTTGYICGPHPMIDQAKPGHTPRRDILMEIAREIDKRGKRLIVYFPSDYDGDVGVAGALGQNTPGFLDRYREFLRHYSVTFGPLIDGWWFDSCQPHPDEYWQKWEEVLRTGNPDTVIAFSGAEFCTGKPLTSLTPRVDYFAGEIHLLEDGKIRRDFMAPGTDVFVNPDGKLRRRGVEPEFYLPDGPFIENAQTQCLLPIGVTFNPAVPNSFCNYSDETLVNFVTAVKSVGGAVTINVPIDFRNGHIEAGNHAQLVRVAQRLGFVAK